MRLIGFNGGYGSGKSTAIKALQEAFPDYHIALVKFAQPLYDIQEFIYGRISSVVKRDRSFIKDRKLLQWIGTDWGRGVDESLWVKIWAEAVSSTNETCSLLFDEDKVIIVCDDVRFDNEGEKIRELGGTVIKIERDNNAAHAQGGTGIKNHASEAGLSPALIDYIIDNNGGLDQFKDSLSTLFKELGINDTNAG